MNEYDRTLVERVDIEAFDGDVVVLSVRSFTLPDTKYKVEANFATGLVRCDCMDARARSKIADFTDDTGIPCKHMRAVIKYLEFGSEILRLFKERK